MKNESFLCFSFYIPTNLETLEILEIPDKTRSTRNSRKTRNLMQGIQQKNPPEDFSSGGL